MFLLSKLVKFTERDVYKKITYMEVTWPVIQIILVMMMIT